MLFDVCALYSRKAVRKIRGEKQCSKRNYKVVYVQLDAKGDKINNSHFLYWISVYSGTIRRPLRDTKPLFLVGLRCL